MVLCLRMQKFPLWQRLLSYLMPIRIKTLKSELSGKLLVNLHHGRKVLDTREVNYSFGALHKVMEQALEKANKMGAKFQNVLLLGYGGGSAAEIIHHKYNRQARITAVDLDPLIFQIAQEEFYSDGVDFICADGLKYIQTPHAYDVIVADIFIGKKTPGEYWKLSFYTDIKNNLTPGGMLVMNTISNKKEGRKFYELFRTQFHETFSMKIFDDNYVFFGKL